MSEPRFLIENFLSPEECNTLIALAEHAGFEPAIVRSNQGQKSMPQVRNNQRLVLSQPEWRDLIWQRLQSMELPQFEGRKAAGLPRDLRFYKYGPGERFKMHKDGPWFEDGMSSELTLLVYLNDGFEGGHTVFRDWDLDPKQGALLLFHHPIWHEGAAVLSGTKYVLRSDVLYR